MRKIIIFSWKSDERNMLFTNQEQVLHKQSINQDCFTFIYINRIAKISKNDDKAISNDLKDSSSLLLYHCPIEKITDSFTLNPNLIYRFVGSSDNENKTRERELYLQFLGNPMDNFEIIWRYFYEYVQQLDVLVKYRNDSATKGKYLELPDFFKGNKDILEYWTKISKDKLDSDASEYQKLSRLMEDHLATFRT